VYLAGRFVALDAADTALIDHLYVLQVVRLEIFASLNVSTNIGALL